MRLRDEILPGVSPAGTERRLYVLHEDLRLEAGREVPPHAHPAATEVYVVAGGDAIVEIAGRSRPASAGDVVVVPPGAVHSIRVGPGGLVFSSFMAFATLPSFLTYRVKRLVQDNPALAAVHRRLRRRR